MLLKLLSFIAMALPLMALANVEKPAGQEILLTEVEVHSTAGIANRVQRRDAQPYEYDPAFEDSSPYFEDDGALEELPPPTSVEHVSPSRSRVITRTTTRPTSKYPQADGVGIAPVVVPIYDEEREYRSPYDNHNPPPFPPR